MPGIAVANGCGLRSLKPLWHIGVPPYVDTRNTRYWAVIDTEDTLVCLCVYRKGALEVVRRLQTRTTA